MNTKILDGNTLKRILTGGARGIRAQIEVINDLNVFPVPDGDTGTNMTRTYESGLASIREADALSVSDVAAKFARGSLLGARGNSGVILSQFFAGMSAALASHETVTVKELADAYAAGVTRAYAAVVNPVEGTMLTVFRESTAYATDHLGEDGTVEDFLSLHIDEAKRSLARTKEILPALIEADVVDSGGAGYLCIAMGMYSSLTGEEGEISYDFEAAQAPASHVDYDVFTTDSPMTYGYCTECLVRLMRAKGDPDSFSVQAMTDALTDAGCDSIVLLRDGDILKVHAHTMTPSDILTLCQRWGEFLNVKIENMNVQHNESFGEDKPRRTAPKKPYGVVTVATGEGLISLFEELGADFVICGGQTGNPSSEEFVRAFEDVGAEHIFVLPNNSNILLTARQAASLFDGERVTVIPTKTVPEGYAALAVFNAAAEDPASVEADMMDAIRNVVSGEITVAIRDAHVGGIAVSEGQYIGILGHDLVTAASDATAAVLDLLSKVEDLDDKELLTLFVGSDVEEDARVAVQEAIEDAYPALDVTSHFGGQEVYHYLIAVE